ncbi:MAG TPA: hypothetical protein VIT63_02630, partial [Nitrospira sp.]
FMESLFAWSGMAFADEDKAKLDNTELAKQTQNLTAGVSLGWATVPSPHGLLRRLRDTGHSALGRYSMCPRPRSIW